jgi:hypothetical protein
MTNSPRPARDRTLRAIMSVMMVVGGLLFAVTDNLWILVLASFSGTISATAADVGPLLTVEQAILPQTAPAERRTSVFVVSEFLTRIPIRS